MVVCLKWGSLSRTKVHMWERALWQKVTAQICAVTFFAEGPCHNMWECAQ